MKAVFSKMTSPNHRMTLMAMGPTTRGCYWSPTVTTTVPSLIHLAAARTLATLRPRETHYEILNLTPSATAKDIRLAFLKLSKQCHPDAIRDPTNHKTFVQVNEAYSVLSRPTSRRDYDASLTDAHHISADRSYGFGHHPESGHYSYNRQYKGHHHHYYETDWARNRTEQTSGNIITNFYTLTACVTCATIGLILHYMHNYLPNPKLKGLRNNLSRQEIEQHDFIMTSQQDGITVYYYAVPKANDPESFEVLAVKRSQVKDSDIDEMQELNSVEYSKQNTLQ